MGLDMLEEINKTVMILSPKLLIRIMGYGVYRVHTIQTRAPLETASRISAHLPQHQDLINHVFYAVLYVGKPVYGVSGEMGL